MPQIWTRAVLIIFDLVFFGALFFISCKIRESLDKLLGVIFQPPLFQNFLIVIFTIMLLLYYEKIYNFRYDFWQETLKIWRSIFFAFLIFMALLALTKNNLYYSRVFLMVYFSIAFVFFPVFKRYTKKLLFMFPLFRSKVLLIAEDKEEKQKFAQEIKDNWYLGQMLVETNAKSVIIISKGIDIARLNKIIEENLAKHKELFIVPYISEINFSHSNILEYYNIRLNTIQVENKLLERKNVFLKKLFDYAFAFITLPFVLIIHIIISILIKLDSVGEIFFRQKRLGKDGKVFWVYKYRTMHTNGDALLKQYLQENPDEIEHYEKYHKYKNDPRITKVGKILRATSLDELPQIINVLKGEMSFVGPRPYMTSESKKLGKNKHFILKVKPGITGLWQVSGRNNLTFKERNELEVWYIKNWSLWADFVILIKTIKIVLTKVGAK